MGRGGKLFVICRGGKLGLFMWLIYYINFGKYGKNLEFNIFKMLVIVGLVVSF